MLSLRKALKRIYNTIDTRVERIMLFFLRGRKAHRWQMHFGEAAFCPAVIYSKYVLTVIASQVSTEQVNLSSAKLQGSQMNQVPIARREFTKTVYCVLTKAARIPHKIL